MIRVLDGYFFAANTVCSFVLILLENTLIDNIKGVDGCMHVYLLLFI